MKNYFNRLSLREQLSQLGSCRLMKKNEFGEKAASLADKKIVIVGCGAQGLNQGLNMRDSGLDISYALRETAIKEQRQSYQNAVANDFQVGSFEELVPQADMLINLTPDKQHTAVIKKLLPYIKKGGILSYSHGFNIVEEGMDIRKDITVIMVAPKCPGTEVREEFKRGFGVPTLIAVHPENDPHGLGLEWAKAYAFATGGHRAGVLESSFVAEVKSDLMGEQTILCGLLQSGSILAFDKMAAQGVNPAYAARLVQNGWEVITEALKHGGITNMMDRLSNPAKIRASQISESLKEKLRPLFQKHMDDIMSGAFSSRMMKDWADGDRDLLSWRAETECTAFEIAQASPDEIPEQEYFDNAVLLVAFVRAGVELAFETMLEAGIGEESAYYESLHEVPLIANTISRKKLFEMNRIISDTAEYGCYLFDHSCKPLIGQYVMQLEPEVIGRPFNRSNAVDNRELIEVNSTIRQHPIEKIGTELRTAMTAMKNLKKDEASKRSTGTLQYV